MARTIYKRHDRAREEVQRLLTAVFASELLSPSPEIWLISPWVRNITIFSNRGGEFQVLDPTWGRRDIRLVDCLVAAVDRGVTLRLKTGPDPGNRSVVRELGRRVRDLGAEERLDAQVSDVLHTKGLLTERCLLRGSMNFTVRGIELNEEAVTYDTDPAAVADMRIALDDQW